MEYRQYLIVDKIVLTCMMFAGIAAYLPDNINAIAIWIAIPMAFLLKFIFDSSLYRNKSFKIFVMLFIWTFISSAWALNPALTIRQCQQMLGGVLVAYIVGKSANKEYMLPWVYTVWILLLLSALYYAKNNILADIVIGQERLNDSKLNANMLAYYTFYSTFSIFILGELFKKRWIRRIVRILFFFMIFLSFFVAIVTASRQVLIIQIPLIISLLYERYLKGSSSKTILLFILAAIGFIAIFWTKAMDIYDNSLLKTRTEIDLGNDSRTLLAKDAFHVGMDHFFFGVGGANYVLYSYNKHFSHNTYLEIFANTGIIGLIMYLYMITSYFKVQIKRYKITKDKLFLMFILFGVIYCLDNIFYVFHPYQWLIAFFILVSSHSDAYYEKNYMNKFIT